MATPKGKFCKCGGLQGWKYADLAGMVAGTNLLMVCSTCDLPSRLITEWCLDCGDEYVLRVKPDTNLLCLDCEPLYV